VGLGRCLADVWYASGLGLVRVQSAGPRLDLTLASYLSLSPVLTLST
jgi:hypothetical protein